jgi:Flp pilus assembly protein TadG
MIKRLYFGARKTLSSTKGGVAVQIGVGLGGLLGMLGLGAESTFLLYKHRQIQSVTDSAALSAAMALDQEYPRDPVSEARAVAAKLGFANGANGVAMNVNSPPSKGRYIGYTDSVEVSVSQPQQLTLMRLFGRSSADVGTRSVARRTEVGRFCILALDNTADEAMFMSNNAELPDEWCGAAVNSTSDSAISMRNNAVIAGPVNTRGEADLDVNAEINGALTEHGPKIADPYADLEIETPPPCTNQQSEGKNNLTLNFTEGRWCDGWDFMNDVTINLSPGVYYIDSKLDIKNNVTVNGLKDVTIIINGNYAMDIGNNATVNINAPTDKNYAGLAFLGRRDATSSVVQKFSNNAVINIQGTIYFPNQIVEFDNNGVTTAEGCINIIGRMVRLMNNAVIRNDCEDTGVKPISPPAVLVE